MEERKPKRAWVWLVLAGIAAVLGGILQYALGPPKADLSGFGGAAIQMFGGIFVNGIGSIFCISAISITRKRTGLMTAAIVLAAINLWLVYEAMN